MKKKKEKNPGDFIILHICNMPRDIIILHVCQKLLSHDVWFLGYGARRSDVQTDGWKK